MVEYHDNSDTLGTEFKTGNQKKLVNLKAVIFTWGQLSGDIFGGHNLGGGEVTGT